VPFFNFIYHYVAIQTQIVFLYAFINIINTTTMKRNWTNIIALVCLYILTFTEAKGQNQVMQQAFDKAKAAGFSGVALVAKDGQIKFHEATGKRHFETNRALKKTDIFELASVSKQFTAMIIMMLKEKGKLNYDDPLSKYVQVPYPDITIRHLLTHTSGLPDYQDIMDKHWDKTKVAGNPDIIEYINRYAPPALFKPNTKYEYSNTGYILLASIAEKASGEDFITLCRNWIFKPFKMKDTDIRTLEAKAKVKNFAAGHLKDSLNRYVNANTFHASDYTVWLGNRKGSGRISSTTQDLLKWDKALYTTQLVSETTLKEAYTPATLVGGIKSNYGFGWEIEMDKAGNTIVLHTGDNPGYSTIIIRHLAQRKTFIVLNNNAHSAMKDLITDLMKY
jgi:CubicO group peptidase (beta-lactamase class C family)